MKRYSTLFFMLFTTIVLFAQDEAYISEKNNELRINAGSFLTIGFPELSYERILSEEAAIGISMGTSLINEENDENVIFSVLPYYRFYFGEKPTAGIFAEVDGAVYTREEYVYSNRYYSTTPKYRTYIGGGLSLGAKFLTKRKKWTGEVLLGLVRGISTAESNTSNLYGRFGLSLGKRF